RAIRAAARRQPRCAHCANRVAARPSSLLSRLLWRVRRAPVPGCCGRSDALPFPAAVAGAGRSRSRAPGGGGGGGAGGGERVRRDACTVSVILRRGAEAAHDAVWYASTDRDEWEKWFAPVSGELHDGGSYQIEGGPHGGIWECKPREHFMLTVGSAESLLTVE